MASMTREKPTEGLYANLTQTYTGWNYNFLKTEAKARYFMPLNSDLRAGRRRQGSGRHHQQLLGGTASELARSLHLLQHAGSWLHAARHGAEDGGRRNPRLLRPMPGASAEMTFPDPDAAGELRLVRCAVCGCGGDRRAGAGCRERGVGCQPAQELRGRVHHLGLAVRPAAWRHGLDPVAEQHGQHDQGLCGRGLPGTGTDAPDLALIRRA